MKIMSSRGSYISSTKINKMKEKLTMIKLSNIFSTNSDIKIEKRKKKRKLSFFTLKYINDEINQQYCMEQDPIKQQAIILILIYQVFINIIYLILSLLSPQYQQEETMAYGVFAVIFLVLIFYNTLIKKVASLNIFIFVILCVYSISINVICRNNVSESIPRRIDISFLHIFVSLYVIDCWIQKSVLVFIAVLMEYIFRSSLFDKDKSPLIVILPIYFIILYLNQRKNKLLFYDYFYQQKTLAASQKLLDHTLPCSVMVLSLNDSYYNANSLLSHSDTQHIDAIKNKEKINPLSKYQLSSVESYQKQNSFKNIIKLLQPQQPQLHSVKDKSKQQSKKSMKSEQKIGKEVNHLENMNGTTNEKVGEKIINSEQILQNNNQNLNGSNLQLPSFNPQTFANNNINNTKANLESASNGKMQDFLGKALRVNFVNTTCLNTFQIKRKHPINENYISQERGRSDFYESEDLQEEILQLLSSIEVQTSEYNISSLNKSNPHDNGQQQFNNKNCGGGFAGLNSQIMTNSIFNQNYCGIHVGDQSEYNLNYAGNSKIQSKKVIISTSLLDIIKQKYKILHQKYIQQIQTNNNHINLKKNNKNEKQIQDIYKNIDLEKEDVFVNCIYKNSKNSKALDIHIIEFQWIDEPAIMIVMTDISQQVKARRLQDLDSYKNELLATVTHDLKTPLNGMLSILEVAQDLTDIKEIKNFIQIVHKNGILLNFLIMDILDYSAMLKGELRLIKQRFDINDVLKDINDLIGFQAKQKNLKFIINNLLEPADCILDSDQRRIKQILLNLTSNALKFTFEGQITIQLERKDPIDDLLTISVQDTGVGIPDTLKPKLFKLYGTYDHNNGSNKHGVGLGLVITKKLASQVGPKDNLHFQSTDKVGTQFSFHLYKNLKVSNLQKFPTFDSPTNVSKNVNLKNQISNFGNGTNIPSQERQISDQQEINIPIVKKKDIQITEFKISQILDTPHSQVSSLIQLLPSTMNQQQKQQDHLQLFGLKTSEDENIDFISNTFENIETKRNFLSPRSMPINPSNMSLSPIREGVQSQQQKYSQLNQYPTIQIGKTNEINTQMSIQSGIFKDDNKNKLDIKESESFDNKTNNTRKKDTQKNITLREQPNIKSLHNIDHQGEVISIQRVIFNKQRKICSNQVHNLNSNELNDGEIKNHPRQLVSKVNHLDQIQSAQLYQFQKPTRVLIVDDTYFNIIALKFLLNNIMNLIIEEAYNGQQALDILNKSKQEHLSGQKENQQDVFKIIFMDINMPIMDGIECTLNIRNDVFYQDIKIIAVTAYSSDSENQKCFDAGMDAHICKPISKQDCLQVLLNLDL